MAQEDKESRTEEATEKKISEAIERGNIPRSRELSIFASLVGILLVFAFIVGPKAAALSEQLLILVDHPGGFAMENGNDASHLLSALALQIGAFLLPMVVVLGVAGLAASFLQNAPQFVLENIRPKWERVSPMAGWKRIFGTPGLVEFLKSLFKFGAIAIVIAIMLNGERKTVVAAIYGDAANIPGTVLGLATRLVSAVCVALIVLVGVDVVWSRFKWRSDLRMTRQELKDEMKQAEGDPLVKSRLRSLARDRARRAMIAAVPKATVVIANPTHFAIALKYNRGRDGAPLVVAKGVDLIALKIREIAAKHSIPVIEDKPLARAMYDAVEVGQFIPAEFYRAVAKILYVLYSRNRHAHA
ncbi:MAG: flagellar biosynthesis protein FlhB [Rhizobiales bacterium]|nr:flagellar biosynthesis protein FlhB [Hyphomicrobiales bacterium]